MHCESAFEKRWEPHHFTINYYTSNKPISQRIVKSIMILKRTIEFSCFRNSSSNQFPGWFSKYIYIYNIVNLVVPSLFKVLKDWGNYKQMINNFFIRKEHLNRVTRGVNMIIAYKLFIKIPDFKPLKKVIKRNISLN